MPRIGVCSWSLRAGSPEDLAAKVQEAGLAHVQIALEPIRTGRWREADVRSALAAAGVEVVSGMSQPAGEDYSTLESIARTGGVRPDATWSANLETLRADAALARRLGIGLVTTHAGFLPESPAEPEWPKMLERLRTVVDLFAAEGVRVAFETGQERAPALAAFLEALDRRDAGVNFDPANMILYGKGEPVAALELLAARVRQIHVKDARPARVPGSWGEEVPAGTGAVDWARFFAVCRARGIGADLLIEREHGDDRVGDVRLARRLVASHLGG